MKKFLLRLAIVLVPFLVLLGVLTCSAYKSEMAVLERDLTCPTNILAAVVGDSRVEVYFDPDEIPWLQNFGLSASPISITAHKARIIAEQNPHLKLLIVDVWPSKFFTDLSVSYTANKFIPEGVALMEIHTRKDMPPIDDGFELRLINGVLSPYIRSIFARDGMRKSQIGGRFFKDKKYFKDGFPVNFGRGCQFGAPYEPAKLSRMATDGEIVLEHLLEDLTAHGVNVILTSTPVLWAEQRWDKDARAYFEQRMQAIADKYNVSWYNWMNEYQDTPEYWADGLHLNDIGAIAFSRDKLPILEKHLQECVHP